MIAHTNRGRLTVEVGGKWRLYTSTIPDGAEPIGVVSRGDLGDIGALVKLSSGSYVQINAGVVRSLDQRKISAALAPCTRCGHPYSADWLDDGETCPNCKLVQ